MVHSPRQNSAEAAKQTLPISRMASRLVLRNVPPLMIQRDGKHIGSSKGNPGALNQKLLQNGKHFLLNDETSPLTLSKVSTRLRTFNSVVLMLSGCWQHTRAGACVGRSIGMMKVNMI